MAKGTPSFKIFLGILIVGAVWFMYTLNSPGSAQNMQHARTGTTTGDLAPDFSLTTVDGQSVSLSDYRGKPVVLYFGATWCPNCHRDLASAQSVYPQYKDSVEFLAIGMDTRESAAVLASYQDQLGLQSATFAQGSSQVNSQYQIRYTTSKFGINADGTIAFSRVGAVSEADWRQLFQSLAQ